MREILFRGKRTDNSEWVYGWFEMFPFGRWPVKASIIPSEDAIDGSYEHVEVNPETVGQFTGLTDKNGKKIFEGDILTIQNGSPFEMTGQIIFEDGCFQLRDPACDMYECLWYKAEEMEVIGNIHDNDLEGLHGN